MISTSRAGPSTVVELAGSISARSASLGRPRTTADTWRGWRFCVQWLLLCTVCCLLFAVAVDVAVVAFVVVCFPHECVSLLVCRPL